MQEERNWIDNLTQELNKLEEIACKCFINLRKAQKTVQPNEKYSQNAGLEIPQVKDFGVSRRNPETDWEQLSEELDRQMDSIRKQDQSLSKLESAYEFVNKVTVNDANQSQHEGSSNELRQSYYELVDLIANEKRKRIAEDNTRALAHQLATYAETAKRVAYLYRRTNSKTDTKR